LGLNVSEISSQAFAGQDDLVSVHLPGTIHSIGEMAFSGCAKLSTLNIPEGTSLIGDYAFLGCKMLSNITLPSSVTSIAENAFEDCSDSLTLYGESGSYAEQLCRRGKRASSSSLPPNSAITSSTAAR
jgi:hypothetical protein